MCKNTETNGTTNYHTNITFYRPGAFAKNTIKEERIFMNLLLDMDDLFIYIMSKEDLMDAVDNVFKAYDVQKKGVLSIGEITCLINDAFNEMDEHQKITKREVQEIMNVIDENHDGMVDVRQLYEIFNKLLEE